MMTRTKLALGTAAAVIGLAAGWTSSGTPGTHAGPLPNRVEQGQSTSDDAKVLANLKRDHMNALPRRQVAQQDAPGIDDAKVLANLKRDHMNALLHERARSR
jgi:hypothetical protein